MKLAWKTIVVTFAISFVLGAVFGRWQTLEKFERRWENPQAKQKWILDRMSCKLSLDGEQKKKVATILEETSPQMEAVRAQTRPQLDALRKQTHDRIREILRPDQQKKMDKMEAEWEERMKRFRPNP